MYLTETHTSELRFVLHDTSLERAEVDMHYLGTAESARILSKFRVELFLLKVSFITYLPCIPAFKEVFF
jgi:hypothetical protein